MTTSIAALKSHHYITLAALTKTALLDEQGNRLPSPQMIDFCTLLCQNRFVSIIDFHTHIFPPEAIDRREEYLQRDDWFRQLYGSPKARMATADELISSMNTASVDVSVVFGFAWADQGLCRAANDYVLEAVSRWPDRLVGFAQLNPAAAGAGAELERCMQSGLCGLGELMPDGQGYTLDDPRLDEVMEYMAHWKRPVLMHCGEPVGHRYPGKSSCTLEPFCRLAARHPDVVLVGAHWGGGLFFYELMPELRESLRNVYYDSAASLLLYGERIFSLAAQIIKHKALFATDYPVISQERFLQHVRGAGLSADALQSFLGGNAARLLQIGGASEHGADPKLCGD